ncbi:MAG: ABC transporter substrate-binding protein [Mycobacteriales bacterium]
MTGRRVGRVLRRSSAAVAVGTVLSLVAANAPAVASVTAPSAGGEVVFQVTAGPDWIDPGLTYYTYGFVLSYAVNRPLYSYGPDESLSPLPDLAEGAPVVSADGQTVTVRIKPGIRYSPPVSREATSYDVKYAIERAFSEHVPSEYVFSYFGDLVGAPSAPGAIVDIPGIATPDAHTIVFRLRRPTAPTLVGALVLPVTVPVPEEYAQPFDAELPSTYDEHVAFTGPYMIRNDAGGNLVGLADDIEVVRNPNWDPTTDYRPAYVDAIRFRWGDDLRQIAQETLDGSHLLCCDASMPPGVEEALSTRPTQVGSEPGHGTRWVALNTTIKPLTNLNVRKALAAVMDRAALRDARGGPVAGELAEHFIAAGVHGFEESGGLAGFGNDYLQAPEGNPSLAREYLLRAREEGLPISADGKYKGPETLLIVGQDGDPGRAVSRLVARQVKKLGFKVDLRLVPPDEMYQRWCGVPAAKVAICPSVGWFMDFPDPQSLLEPTFSGGAIRPTHNVNWSLLDVPRINAAIEAAAILPPGSDRYRAWAEVNRMIVEQAPGIPYLWDTSYAFSSADVAGVMNPYYSTWDLSFTSIRS